jgi:hypothetical protein
MLLVAGFLPRQPGFESASSNVESVMDRAAVWEVSYESFGYTCHSIAPQSSSSSIIHGCCSSPITGHRIIGLGSTEVPSVNKEGAVTCYNLVCNGKFPPLTNGVRRLAPVSNSASGGF